MSTCACEAPAATPSASSRWLQLRPPRPQQPGTCASSPPINSDLFDLIAADLHVSDHSARKVVPAADSQQQRRRIHSVARRSQRPPSKHYSHSHTRAITSRCVALLSHEGSKPMSGRSLLHTLAAAAAAAAAEFLSLLHLPYPLSHRRPYPRRQRDVMRPPGDPTAATGRRIRAAGITPSGVPAGTTATQPPAGIRLRAGCRPRTGLRLRAGIRRLAGLLRRHGSDPAPDHFSICSTRCAARSQHSEPVPNGPGSEPIEDRVDDVVADIPATR